MERFTREDERRFQKTVKWACLIMVVFYFLLWLLFSGCSHIKITPKDIGLSVLGAAASVVTHEAGHYIAMGGDMEFHGLNWTTDRDIGDLERNAGLIAQAISSEIILWTGAEGPLWDSWLTVNLFEEVTYPTIRRNTGDFEDMENPGPWTALWLAHGGSVAYRMYDRKSFSWALRKEKGGASVVYRMEF